MMSRNRLRAWAFCAAATASMGSSTLPAADKLKPEDLVAKHLDSIASQEVRSHVRTRVAQGTGRFEIVLGGKGELQGGAYFLSEGDKVRYLIDFGNPSYLREDFAYDGDKQSVGYISPGQYSQLGDFLNLYKDILKEGLIGGALSTAWPLLHVDQRKPRLKYGGMKKMDSQECHVLNYQMRKGGGDLRIKLYFDPETFRHLGSDYEIKTPAAQMGRTPGTSSQVRQANWLLTERFTDFKEVESNTLPHKWTMQLSIDSGTGSSHTIWQWVTEYETIAHNQPIEEGYFNVQDKSDDSH